MDYRGKVILAPMVRVGTLPFRLLALRHGADIVYCEEIIDFKILQCTRKENDILNTVDYVMLDGTVVFRTCPEEKGKVVFQLGTADPERAAKIGKFIEKDVAAIDINMGCPKDYSVKGGMGAALLSHPEKIKEILTSLVAAVSIPVTCKIRILPELDKTLELVDIIASTGVKALAVHGRMRDERPRDMNHDDVIEKIARHVNIPIIANGGSRETIRFHEDIEYFRQVTGAASVMIARAAMWNPSIFRPGERVPSLNLVREYLELAVRYENHLPSTKYCVQQLVLGLADPPQLRESHSAATDKEMCAVWDISDVYERVMREREGRRRRVEGDGDGDCPVAGKRSKVEGEDGVPHVRAEYRYIRKLFPGRSPKQNLNELCKKNRWPLPEYDTVEEKIEKMFYSTVTVNGCRYSTINGDRNKRFTEQACACVCLQHLGVPTGCREDDT